MALQPSTLLKTLSKTSLNDCLSQFAKKDGESKVFGNWSDLERDYGLDAISSGKGSILVKTNGRFGSVYGLSGLAAIGI